MAKNSNSTVIHAGMLKRELLDVADRLGLRGVTKLRKAELLKTIRAALRRPKGRAAAKTEQGGTAKPRKAPAKAAGAKAVKAAPKQKKPKRAAKGAKNGAAAKRKTKKKEPVAAEAHDSAQPEPSAAMSDQSRVTAAKYGVGIPFPEDDLRRVDAHLPGLPDGYGEDRLVLLPRDPEWLYAYWDLRGETKDGARARGGVTFSLRLFEQREGGLEPMAEQWLHELARGWYIPVPSPGQAYVAEVGYRDADGGWLRLLQSNVVSVPPAGPSSIIADELVTIHPDEDPDQRAPEVNEATAVRRDRDRAAGPRGGAAGGARPAGQPHEAAYAASLGDSGSVAPGSAASRPGGESAPSSPRGGPAWSGSHTVSHLGGPGGGEADTENAAEKSFWLVAEAELVVFGATEPGAKLTLGGEELRLREDGTFSARMAFPDGKIVIPIEAVAADGEQQQGLTLRFERSTRKQS